MTSAQVVATLLGIALSSMAPDGIRSGARDSGGKTRYVDCESGGTIAKALDKARPGDIVFVSGVCVENVELGEGLFGVTLEGGGTATIAAADPTLDTVRIYADEVVIRGLTITGGRDGVNLRGANSVLIAGNVIEHNLNHGIDIHRNSMGMVIDNTIRTNGRNGILVFENSVGRIGFSEFTSSVTGTNTIEHNGINGIFVTRSSTADIAFNTIQMNGAAGVSIERGSHADVRVNAISQNTTDAVAVSFGSGANLGAGGAQNTSTATNTGFAVSCRIGGYVAGSVGLLLGTAGARNVTTGCADATTP
jgi:parallel beta-helix repeat protein